MWLMIDSKLFTQIKRELENMDNTVCHGSIAVIGATGAVGRTMISILEQKNFSRDKLFVLASHRSCGLPIPYSNQQRRSQKNPFIATNNVDEKCNQEFSSSFDGTFDVASNNKELEKKFIFVEDLQSFDFQKVQFALFSAGSDVSKSFVQRALDAGCTVIDNTSYFRMRDDVPLVVFGVNHQSINQTQLISNPNCCVMQLSVSLKPLSDLFGIIRVLVSTYQSTSGAGKQLSDRLVQETSKRLLDEDFQVNQQTIGFNLIPKIGTFLKNGYTTEEEKIEQEIKKIFNSTIQVSATCVRVPVFIGHSISVTVQLDKKFDLLDIRAAFLEISGLTFIDDEEAPYVTPSECAGTDSVYVGRLRRDRALENAITFWVVADNLRKGAALNAIQIMEELIKQKELQKAA
jgi:aspartate-semialdehyde dehydrogenase